MRRAPGLEQSAVDARGPVGPCRYHALRPIGLARVLDRAGLVEKRQFPRCHSSKVPIRQSRHHLTLTLASLLTSLTMRGIARLRYSAASSNICSNFWLTGAPFFP